jgi:hypothetical protein
VSERGVFYLTGGVLAASVILGGGTRGGFLGDVILQCIAVVLLCTALYQLIASRAIRRLKWVLLFAALIVAVPALQLVPLPTSLWSLLPGRETLSETYRLIHQDQPLLPLTMSSDATWLSALALIPPMAVFLGCLTLGYAERRSISTIVIAMGAVSLLLGLLQLAQGPNSALRFFAFTNNTEAVGFFANRNHFAALLYCAMLFTAAWLVDSIIKVGLQPRRKAMQSHGLFILAASLLIFVTFIAGQLMARSRAGLGLSIVALLAALALGLSDRRAASSGARSAKLINGSAAETIILSLQFGL